MQVDNLTRAISINKIQVLDCSLAPIKRLERLLAHELAMFVSTDEYCTSQYCPAMTAHGICDNKVEQARMRQSDGTCLSKCEGLAKGDSILKLHAIRFCQDCLMVSFHGLQVVRED